MPVNHNRRRITIKNGSQAHSLVKALAEPELKKKSSEGHSGRKRYSSQKYKIREFFLNP